MLPRIRIRRQFNPHPIAWAFAGCIVIWWLIISFLLDRLFGE